MKLSKLLCLSLLVFLFTQCKNTDTEITDKDPAVETKLCLGDPLIELIISTSGEISLMFPECFTATPAQGIDTYVGRLEAPDHDVTIVYDIGNFSSPNIDENSTTKVIVQGEEKVFWHEIIEDKLYFTFPDASGVANFYTDQVEHRADLVEFFKSLKVK